MVVDRVFDPIVRGTKSNMAEENVMDVPSQNSADDRGNQDFGSEDFGNRDFGNREFGSQSFGNEDFGNQASGDGETSGSDAIVSKERGSLSPAKSLIAPAAAIIAALSVQSSGGGTTSR